MSSISSLLLRQCTCPCSARALACNAKPKGGGGGGQGFGAKPDENKAFRFKQANRQKQLKKSTGASKNLINAMSELQKSRTMPKQGGTSVFGADQMTWQEVDDAVNEYPGQRVFTAIGSGEEDFKTSMVAVVESVIDCRVHEEAVVVRPSSGGKYWSVRIGPVVVQNSEQVLDIYARMKADGRLKWFI